MSVHGMKQGLERTDATDGVNAESCPQYTSPRVMTLLQTITGYLGGNMVDMVILNTERREREWKRDP